MAIESLFDRGTLEDWREFVRAMRRDPSIADRALCVCAYRAPDGAEGIARALIDHVYPGRATGAPAPGAPSRSRP